jgi:hypothetical protein
VTFALLAKVDPMSLCAKFARSQYAAKLGGLSRIELPF